MNIYPARPVLMEATNFPLPLLAGAHPRTVTELNYNCI
jgi:hypothetical protein